MNKYDVVIGLEIHAQMNTKTKMFCRCSNDSFNKIPNSNVCPICMGFPGQLPLLNKESVRKGIIAGLSLNCEIPEISKFDRKNYFYPDSPKGYQITQFDKPISINGNITITTSKGEKIIHINRMHLEDDAGKLTHTSSGTLCDYNRSGTPLMEIVSEPEIFSVEEASTYAREIQKIMRYCGSSDADMEKGMMRFDLNLSLKPKGSDTLGTRAEIKNLNSFQSLEKAAEYEIKRQSQLLDNGEKVAQETRGWDDKLQKTVSQRSKEEAMDYRYFPEPDLPPIQASKELVNELRKFVPELPHDKKKRFASEFNLLEDDIRILTSTPELANYFETANAISNDPKTTCAFINTVLSAYLKEDQISIKESPVSAENLGKLVKLIKDGIISNNVAKSTVFEAMYEEGQNPEKIVEEKGLKQVSDTGALEEMAKKAIKTLPQAAEDVRNGEIKAIGALVGFIMKESKGSANPKAVNEILKKLLNS